MIYARAIHFAATIMVAGVTFFIAFIAEPALRAMPYGTLLAVTLRLRLAWIAWIGLVLFVPSDAAWLVLTAASMSGQPAGDIFTQGVLWTVLPQTDFGVDWVARFVAACVLAGVFVSFLSARRAKPAWLLAAVTLAAALAGSLAWTGHAIGGRGIQGVLHPAADILHLLAAAAWVGGLAPLALLLAATGEDAAGLAVARIATARFSTLGVASVAVLLFTGIVNTWYLVGSIPALVGTQYGRLLLIKVALFAAMVGIAAINRFWLTPRLVETPSVAAAREARRRLCRNAVIEAFMGAVIIAIVAVLGTLPPASHSHHHHATDGAMPAHAFQHIHSEQGMADVTIDPGRVGRARAAIHLLNDDLETLDAREVTLTLTAPVAGEKPIARSASLGSDGVWTVEGIDLSQAGNWTVTVGALLGANTGTRRLVLTGQIVIEP